jgi:hypothetical protein
MCEEQFGELGTVQVDNPVRNDAVAVLCGFLSLLSVSS